jgi:cell division protein FtsB
MAISPRQKLFIKAGILGLFLMLALILFSDNGVFDLIQIREERDRVIQKNVKLEQENRDYYQEIERLKHDRKYIESIARKELGLVGKDEIIIQTAEEKEPDQP